MKANINPVAAGVIVVIVLVVALYFGMRSSGPAAKSHTPMDMGKMMGKAPIAPPAEVLAVESQVFRGTDYLDKEIDTLQRWARAAPKDYRPLLRLFYVYLDLGWRHEAGLMSEQALRLAPTEAGCQEAGAISHY